MTSATRHAPSSPGQGDWQDTLARAGLTGKGILHVVLGILAFQLAIGSKDTKDAVGQSGAIKWITEMPGGSVLIWIVALCLLSLALWRLITVFTGDPVKDDDAKDKASYVFKVVVYGTLGVSALRAAISGGSGGGSGGGNQEQQAASTVLDWPGGRFILMAVGLGIIGVAGYMVYKHALNAEFVERLDVGEQDKAATFGRWGYGLRSIAYALVGALVLQAGVQGDSSDAKGVAGALKSVSDESWGTVLLFLVAAGFACYGIYCFFEAKHRRAT